MISKKLSKLIPKFFKSGLKRKDQENGKILKPYHEKLNDKNISNLYFKISLLDASVITASFQTTHRGCDLFEHVCSYLNLNERQYFGLKIPQLDDIGSIWVDMDKTISNNFKDIKDEPIHLIFCVRFYISDPCTLKEEITRYMFYLQIKSDILNGTTDIEYYSSTELASYVLQSELGDFDVDEHTLGYVSEFRFIANQNIKFERRVAYLHKKLTGFQPSYVENRYLDKAKWLETYGVTLFIAKKTEHFVLYIGISPHAIVVYKDKEKVTRYLWSRISKISRKKKFLLIKAKDNKSFDHIYSFEICSKDICRFIYKRCLEHFSFYKQYAANNSVNRLKKLRNNSVMNISNMSAISTFTCNGDEPIVKRTPSKRHERRLSTVNQCNVTNINTTLINKQTDGFIREHKQDDDNDSIESPISVKSMPYSSKNFLKSHPRNSLISLNKSTYNSQYLHGRNRPDYDNSISDTESHRKRMRKAIKPPAEFAQHFRYVDSNDATEDVQFTEVTINDDEKVRKMYKHAINKYRNKINSNHYKSYTAQHQDQSKIYYPKPINATSHNISTKYQMRKSSQIRYDQNTSAFVPVDGNSSTNTSRVNDTFLPTNVVFPRKLNKNVCFINLIISNIRPLDLSKHIQSAFNPNIKSSELVTDI
ncbi:hypothetical protein A3Q56_04192 [Intoshia linei]|uniref:FERM domain-containing protein n=1 Tax=Intoshia linei TaxID=1819745 RepID=A0A177B1E3_9BILA|nr:hypothetical protein A3Q56_04192 [Intoshia linei]